MTSTFKAGALGALALAFAAACTKDEPTADTDGADTVAIESFTEANVAVKPSALGMPVSINAVMVSLVDFAADGIWRPAASETPLTDRQWLLAEQDAINLIASATLITTAGTGVNDAEWVQDDDWRRWSADMQSTALQAKSAVDQKDQERLLLVGDRLVEICQTCHQKYKPSLPSMGVTRFPIYPKRDGTLTPP